MTGASAARAAARVDTALEPLLAAVAAGAALGAVREWRVLTTGYEDCNIDLTTGAARVVVKLFATDRADGIAERTAGLILCARAAGVRHPRLHHDRHGQFVHHHGHHRALIMDFVAGATFYDLARPAAGTARGPDNDEVAAVLEQAARLHDLDVHPRFVPDPWAITNLTALAQQLHDGLDADQRDLVAQAVDAVAAIDRAPLPAALIHADLTKGNVLVSSAGEITLLDFAVANRYPRVQELAVIAANLTHGRPDPLPDRVEIIADLYSRVAREPLSVDERHALRAFSHAAAAMELLGALREWQLGDQGTETAYLIDLGLAGLRDHAAARRAGRQ